MLVGRPTPSVPVRLVPPRDFENTVTEDDTRLAPANHLGEAHEEMVNAGRTLRRVRAERVAVVERHAGVELTDLLRQLGPADKSR